MLKSEVLKLLSTSNGRGRVQSLGGKIVKRSDFIKTLYNKIGFKKSGNTAILKQRNGDAAKYLNSVYTVCFSP